MKCTTAQKLSSDYLDGELSAERNAAIRGHLRTCAECETLYAEERALIDAASQLDRPEPPSRIWDAIQERIAEEEIRDSKQPGWRLWLREHGRFAGTGLGLAAVATTLFLFARPLNRSEPERAPLAQESGSEQQEAALQDRHEDLVASELEQVDRHYIETIRELRDIVEEDRAVWSPVEAERVDARLEGFRRQAIARRMEFSTRSNAHPDARGELHANYRAEIDFLQDLLAGEIPGPEASGSSAMELVP